MTASPELTVGERAETFNLPSDLRDTGVQTAPIVLSVGSNGGVVLANSGDMRIKGGPSYSLLTLLEWSSGRVNDARTWLGRFLIRQSMRGGVNVI